MPAFRQTSWTVSPLARSRSKSRSKRATSSAVRRFRMGPSLAQCTEGLPFQVDQFLGRRPERVTEPDDPRLLSELRAGRSDACTELVRSQHETVSRSLFPLPHDVHMP